MKKGYIFLIIVGILLLISAIGLVIASNTEVKEETYVVNLRVEGTSGYPPHLTQLVNEGVENQMVLVSILPLNFKGLSIGEPSASITGRINLDCGGIYNETQDFYVSTTNPGDKMIQRFEFKNIPKERVCSIEVIPTECTSQITPSTCQLTKLKEIVRIP